MKDWPSRIARFVNSKDLDHELVVVAISYLFVFAGAWDDGIVGLPPSNWSRTFEWIMALILVAELLSRMIFMKRRGIGFFFLFCLDAVSLATLIPALTGLALLRLVRLLYASFRTAHLIDLAARKHHRPIYLLNIYPLVVPLAAAVLYLAERESRHPAVNNYLDALLMCFGFALTLGQSRPNTYIGNLICGTLFVGGIICIGIIANSLTNRYTPDR